MLYSVNGKLIHMEQGMAVVECGGVGFKCKTTLNTQKNIRLGDQVCLYTYMSVREDAIELFGFESQMELGTFKNLISVNGVGPKVGLAILSVLSPEQVALSVSAGDIKAITRANGVGPKVAQRIILELKDKIGLAVAADSSGGMTAGAAPLSLGNTAKAMEALSVLGYSASDVSPVLAQLDSSLPVEQLISETLKRMGGK